MSALLAGTDRSHAREPRGAARPTTPSWGFPEWFLLAQLILPALLFLPGTQSVRVPIRIAPFALCLLPLCFAKPRRLPKHPAAASLVVAVAYLSLMILHPNTNSILAGIGQMMLYFAVLAPVFWVPALVRHPAQLRRLLAIMLVFNAVNSCVGILQVRNPERWLPRDFSEVISSGQLSLGGLVYEGAGGSAVVRPPGLSDSPGAAAGAGMLALTLGLAFCFLRTNVLQKGLCLVASLAGLAVIFLSHVRLLLLLGMGSLAVYGVVLILQQRMARAMALMKMTMLVALTGWTIAIAFGGHSIHERFASLLEDDPLSVYNESKRGPMMRGAFETLIWDYPLGAGLGRWGMIRRYFGNESNVKSPMIWAELQVPAWILDGGVVLLACYTIALMVVAAQQLSMALQSVSPLLQDLAAIVLALSAATVAGVFGGTPFVAQHGVQFWFLAGALYGVWLHGPDQAQRRRAGRPVAATAMAARVAERNLADRPVTGSHLATTVVATGGVE